MEDLEANIKVGTKLYQIIYGNFERPVETVGRLILNIDWEQRFHAHAVPVNLDQLNLTDEQINAINKLPPHEAEHLQAFRDMRMAGQGPRPQGGGKGGKPELEEGGYAGPLRNLPGST